MPPPRQADLPNTPPPERCGESTRNCPRVSCGTFHESAHAASVFRPQPHPVSDILLPFPETHINRVMQAHPQHKSSRIFFHSFRILFFCPCMYFHVQLYLRIRQQAQTLFSLYAACAKRKNSWQASMLPPAAYHRSIFPGTHRSSLLLSFLPEKRW